MGLNQVITLSCVSWEIKVRLFCDLLGISVYGI
jgi:hypothetical protein